jgi:hypothetical protein
VEITFPGSYRLTSNLHVTDANTTVISVTADDVSLDLNGFVISGPTACGVNVGDPCSPLGNGDGVVASGLQGQFRIHDGEIRGMGRVGVKTSGAGAIVERLMVRHNGSHGILLSETGIVRDNVVTRNGADGINATIAVITGNTLSRNGDRGIRSLGTSTIIGNVVEVNAVGISAGQNSVVRNNVIWSNLGAGLAGGLAVGYSENVITLNTPDVANASALQLGINVCGNDTICP